MLYVPEDSCPSLSITSLNDSVSIGALLILQNSTALVIGFKGSNIISNSLSSFTKSIQ